MSKEKQQSVVLMIWHKSMDSLLKNTDDVVSRHEATDIKAAYSVVACGLWSKCVTPLILAGIMDHLMGGCGFAQAVPASHFPSLSAEEDLLMFKPDAEVHNIFIS